MNYTIEYECMKQGLYPAGDLNDIKQIFCPGSEENVVTVLCIDDNGILKWMITASECDGK